MCKVWSRSTKILIEAIGKWRWGGFSKFHANSDFPLRLKIIYANFRHILSKIIKIILLGGQKERGSVLKFLVDRDLLWSLVCKFSLNSVKNCQNYVLRDEKVGIRVVLWNLMEIVSFLFFWFASIQIFVKLCQELPKFCFKGWEKGWSGFSKPYLDLPLVFKFLF